MEYQRIKYFLEAARTLNFTKAAENLYITPQSFGKQIALLEKEMGTSLFDRSTRSVSLSGDGRKCYEKLLVKVEELEREYALLTESFKKEKNEISMGFYGSMRQDTMVSPIVMNLLGNFPNYDVSIKLMELRKLSEGLSDGSLDLAVTVIREADAFWKNCNVITLKKYPAQLVTSMYHPWNVKKEITKKDMLEYPYLTIDIPGVKNDKYFKTLPCREIVVEPNYETLLIDLQKRNGFTIINESFDTLQERKLKTFEFNVNPFDFSYAILYKKNSNKQHLQDICRAIRESYEE